LTGIEQCKVDTYKEQIGMAEERIKHYKKQRDDKEQAGELIYNQIRDAISYQEERWKTA
jgi:flagellar capping protein FliD